MQLPNAKAAKHGLCPKLPLLLPPPPTPSGASSLRSALPTQPSKPSLVQRAGRYQATPVQGHGTGDHCPLVTIIVIIIINGCNKSLAQKKHSNFHLLWKGRAHQRQKQEKSSTFQKEKREWRDRRGKKERKQNEAEGGKKVVLQCALCENQKTKTFNT